MKFRQSLGSRVRLVSVKHLKYGIAVERSGGSGDGDRARDCRRWAPFAVMYVSDSTVKRRLCAVEVTLVDPVRLLPRMITRVPTFPLMGTVSTSGLRLLFKLKTVP